MTVSPQCCEWSALETVLTLDSKDRLYRMDVLLYPLCRIQVNTYMCVYVCVCCYHCVYGFMQSNLVLFSVTVKRALFVLLKEGNCLSDSQKCFV